MFHWTVHLKGPSEKQHTTLAVGHKLYFFGNNVVNVMGAKKVEIDVHVFYTVSLRWMKLCVGGNLEIPSRYCGYTAVLIEYIAYIWGGYPYCNVLYAFDVDSHKWFIPQVSGTIPEGRCNHSACVLGKVMYIHGGMILSRYLNDMYKLDTSTMVWCLINTRGTPTSRHLSHNHSATIIGTKMFVYGGAGISDDRLFKTIKVFDTETNLWLNTPSTQLVPERRSCHAAFTYNGELYLFGGYDPTTVNEGFNDMWKFSPESFFWKKVEPKGKVLSVRNRNCCCMVGDCVFIFYGTKGIHKLYVLDLNPSLKTLCKLAVIQYGLEQSELPHDIRWELAALQTAAEE